MRKNILGKRNGLMSSNQETQKMATEMFDIFYQYCLEHGIEPKDVVYGWSDGTLFLLEEDEVGI